MRYSVRPARWGDRGFVLRISLEFYRSEFRDPKVIEPIVQIEREMSDRFQKGQTLVLEDRGMPAGLLQFDIYELQLSGLRVAENAHLYISPASRSNEAFLVFMQAYVDAARASKCDQVRLVFDGKRRSKALARLAQIAGFKVIGAILGKKVEQKKGEANNGELVGTHVGPPSFRSLAFMVASPEFRIRSLPRLVFNQIHNLNTLSSNLHLSEIYRDKVPFFWRIILAEYCRRNLDRSPFLLVSGLYLPSKGMINKLEELACLRNCSEIIVNCSTVGFDERIAFPTYESNGFSIYGYRTVYCLSS